MSPTIQPIIKILKKPELNINSELPAINTIINYSQSFISSLETSHESDTLCIYKEQLLQLETMEKQMERIKSILYKNSTQSSTESKARSITSAVINDNVTISRIEYSNLKKKTDHYNDLKKKVSLWDNIVQTFCKKQFAFHDMRAQRFIG